MVVHDDDLGPALAEIMQVLISALSGVVVPLAINRRVERGRGSVAANAQGSIRICPRIENIYSISMAISMRKNVVTMGWNGVP